jgi:SAM-dependent methyltransferase
MAERPWDEPPPTRGQTYPTLARLLSRNLAGECGLLRLRAALSLRLRLVRALGPRSTFELLQGRLRNEPLPFFRNASSRFKDKLLLELGGPSRPFQSLIPIYRICSAVDNVEWRSWSTVGGGPVEGGSAEPGPRLAPHSFVAEATKLSMIPSGTYDGVISSHVLEHIANPIKALKEWRRVLRGDGVLLAVVPRRELGFDHQRPETPFEHLLADYESDVAEDDMTHAAEVLSLHDVSMDSGAWPIEQYRFRVNHNLYYRVIHHHVFGDSALSRTVEAGGFVIDCIVSSPVLGSVVLATAGDHAG